MVIRLVFTLILTVASSMQAAIVLKGDDQAAANETFSFRVQGSAMSTLPESVGLNLYVTAHPDDGGNDQVKQFAVARVSRDSTQFLGLTPQGVTLNTEKNVGNPLYDQGVAHFALFNGQESILSGANERPVVVLNSDLRTIYMINNFTPTAKNVQVLSVHNNNIPLGILSNKMNIPDAAAAVTSGIVGLTTANPYIFSAVGVNGGSFGDIGSGIAVAVIGSVANFTGPLIIDGPTGEFSRDTGNRAVPLDITSTQLRIGASLASIGTIVDLHWHKTVGKLYIALQITGGAAGTDGGRAIAVARVNKNSSLTIEEIVPAAAITGTNKIIGAVGSSVEVSIHKVRGMFSSTALPYLVVAGGVGTPAATRRTVFAVPLVSGNNDVALNGTIAAKDADPENLFTDTTHAVFAGRVIKEPATTAAQMPLSTDAATQVGGGALVNGDIVDLFVYQDAVFVTVQTAATDQVPGVFYSQPLFESDGKIKGWTTWQRAVGLPDHDQSVLLDPATGFFSTLVANSSNEVKIVKRTEWSDGDTSGMASLSSILEEFMPKAQAGVQGIHSFVVTDTTLATATPALLDISVLVATGLNTVSLAETSRVVSGAVIPTTGPEFNSVTFDNGTLTQTLPVGAAKVVNIQGGVLDEAGPIVAAEIARDGSAGTNGWLFVGGSNGMAVLSQANGNGWNPATGLSVGFTGLVNGMAFKRVGNFSHIRKIINDGQFLYVLTLDKLVRIDLTQATPGLGIITEVVLATANSIPQIRSDSSFLDVVISEKLAILATSDGLVRVANGFNIQEGSAGGLQWQMVPTPEAIGPIRQLIPITKTGRGQDIARSTGGGMLYVLSAYRGKNQAQVFRYDVAQVTTGSVTSNTVRRIDDLFVENIASYFTNFGIFRKDFATDGSLFYGTQSEILTEESSQLSVIFSKEGIHTGSRFVSNKIVPANLEDSTLIAGMIQNSASGTWLVAGDHGLRANE